MKAPTRWRAGQLYRLGREGRRHESEVARKGLQYLLTAIGTLATAAALGLSRETVRRWAKGARSPSGPVAKLIVRLALDIHQSPHAWRAYAAHAWPEQLRVRAGLLPWAVRLPEADLATALTKAITGDRKPETGCRDPEPGEEARPRTAAARQWAMQCRQKREPKPVELPDD